MKNKKTIVGILILVVIVVALFIFIDPVTRYRNHQLKDALQTLSNDSESTFEETIPFEWDVIYKIQPYTTKDDIEETTGVSSRYFKELDYDEMQQLYVVKDGKVVAYIAGRTDYSIIDEMPEKVNYGEEVDIS